MELAKIGTPGNRLPFRCLNRVTFVITVDARGHGDSDWSPEAHYDSDDVGRDIHAIVSNLSRRPAVVGASMGGMGCLAAQRLHNRQLFEAVSPRGHHPRL